MCEHFLKELAQFLVDQDDAWYPKAIDIEIKEAREDGQLAAPEWHTLLTEIRRLKQRELTGAEI